MTIPLWVTLFAFVVFVGLYFVGKRTEDVAARTGWWQRQKTASRTRLTSVWIFTIITLPIVLLQAKASWVIRGAVFVVFLGLLGLATRWISSGHDK